MFPIRIAFLWHMHQPVYRDALTGRRELPWVRMHALKDYYGMLRILRDFPNLKATYNLVPSLLEQLEQLVSDHRGTGPRVPDRFSETFRKDATALTPHDTRFLVRHFFSANYNRMIRPYPRYKYLFKKREVLRKKRGKAPHGGFDISELRDIQVWFFLCYFDREYQECDPRIRGLVEKGAMFSEGDKETLLEAERELSAKIIPAYREYADAGRIELSTTPYHHPILPLLLDPQCGRIANPSLPKYRLNFNWRDEAADQVTSALDFMETRFGRRPMGMWPSEGALSFEVVHMLDNLGVAWTATDELNLNKSVGDGHGFHRDIEGTVTEPDVLYRPYVLKGGTTRIFFRDRVLSDLIGFQYSRLAAKKAAADFHRRLRNIGKMAQRRNIDPDSFVVPIILDGENSWEHYHKSGRDFFKQLFRLIDTDDTIETVTFSQCLEIEPAVLDTLSPGSWIGGNFDIWIGHREHRAAWKLIREARKVFREHKDRLTPEKQKEVLKYIHIARGSDWFWWFGKENRTIDLDIFDRLFRSNLLKVYELMQIAPPAKLLKPVPRKLKR
ncbi:MAG: glycoside hydrolase [bacterium]|nr:glycoside hydrolase [bacterium]